jgi:hypothetical protein
MLNKLLILFLSVATTSLAYIYGNNDVVFYANVLAFTFLNLANNIKFILGGFHSLSLVLVKCYLLYIEIELLIQRELPLNERRNAIQERRKLNDKKLKLSSKLSTSGIRGGGI